MAMASAIASSHTLPRHSCVISCHVSPSSSCSRMIQTMMRVPLNVGWPPQISGSATRWRPSSMRQGGPLVFAFIKLPLSMRRSWHEGKPAFLWRSCGFVGPRHPLVAGGPPTVFFLVGHRPLGGGKGRHRKKSSDAAAQRSAPHLRPSPTARGCTNFGPPILGGAGARTATSARAGLATPRSYAAESAVRPGHVSSRPGKL